GSLISPLSLLQIKSNQTLKHICISLYSRYTALSSGSVTSLQVYICVRVCVRLVSQGRRNICDDCSSCIYRQYAKILNILMRLEPDLTLLDVHS
ncbi:hypothetical protein GIB67_027607, partial [Kingdonia uniflora]